MPSNRHPLHRKKIRTEREGSMSLALRRLSTTQPDFKASLANVLAFEKKTDESISTIVAGILEDVRKNGDKAVLEYSNRFDRLGINDAKALEISLEDCQAARQPILLLS